MREVELAPRTLGSTTQFYTLVTCPAEQIRCAGPPDSSMLPFKPFKPQATALTTLATRLQPAGELTRNLATVLPHNHHQPQPAQPTVIHPSNCCSHSTQAQQHPLTVNSSACGTISMTTQHAQHRSCHAAPAKSCASVTTESRAPPARHTSTQLHNHLLLRA